MAINRKEDFKRKLAAGNFIFLKNPKHLDDCVYRIWHKIIRVDHSVGVFIECVGRVYIFKFDEILMVKEYSIEEQKLKDEIAELEDANYSLLQIIGKNIELEEKYNKVVAENKKLKKVIDAWCVGYETCKRYREESNG